MTKAKLAALLLAVFTLISAAMAAVPTDLSCTPFNNSNVQFCENLDQIGTGIGLMSYKVNLGLPTLLIGLLIVAVIAALVGAFVVLIAGALKHVNIGVGGKGKGRF
jgi:hypothetical protein